MEKVSEPRRECVVSLFWFLFQPELTAAGKEGNKVMRPFLSKPICRRLDTSPLLWFTVHFAYKGVLFFEDILSHIFAVCTAS